MLYYSMKNKAFGITDLQCRTFAMKRVLMYVHCSVTRGVMQYWASAGNLLVIRKCPGVFFVLCNDFDHIGWIPQVLEDCSGLEDYSYVHT